MLYKKTPNTCEIGADVKQDLAALHDVTFDENGISSKCCGCCVKAFNAVGVAVPPTIRETV